MYGGDGEDDETLEPNFEKLQTYEDYLDFYVTWKDLFYLKSDETARTIVTLGYRVPELLSRDQFDEMVANIRAEREEKKKDDTYLAKEIKSDQISCPLMEALAAREKSNRTGYESCIIFLRDVNKKGQEISGYIDFKARLDKEQATWLDYYTGKKKLSPTPQDLCFYNWATFYCSCNSSENYAIVTDVKSGLRFMNKLDRKIITVDPFGYTGDNTTRTGINSPNYLQCALYDHSMRAKA
jgi:hypothetical protein